MIYGLYERTTWCTLWSLDQYASAFCRGNVSRARHRVASRALPTPPLSSSRTNFRGHEGFLPPSHLIGKSPIDSANAKGGMMANIDAFNATNVFVDSPAQGCQSLAVSHKESRHLSRCGCCIGGVPQVNPSPWYHL
jgi:hypothetical protein